MNKEPQEAFLVALLFFMMNLLINKLERAFNLTLDLVDSLSDEKLLLTLKDLPSNRIGDQLWCVIGARESYLKAIQNSTWSGFSCSLQDVTSKSEIIKHLQKSSTDTFSFLKHASLSDKQIDMMLNLLEHEVQHHGQLIRYFYGNQLKFPQSWNERYTV